jgi:hypothetical protein
MLAVRSTETTSVRITRICAGSCQSLISQYLPLDSGKSPRARESRLMEHWRATRHWVRCQCTPHIMGSTGSSPRAASFVEHLVGSNANIYRFNEPSFVDRSGEVTGFTLGNNNTGNLVSTWYVSDKPSLWHHTYSSSKYLNIFSVKF